MSDETGDTPFDAEAMAREWEAVGEAPLAALLQRAYDAGEKAWQRRIEAATERLVAKGILPDAQPSTPCALCEAPAEEGPHCRTCGHLLSEPKPLGVTFIGEGWKFTGVTILSEEGRQDFVPAPEGTVSDE